ncbi:PAS domain S-box protein [Pseudoxanthomonas composti]|nr:PAS domain S-box protein [Pseudoxanthomonas composti]
MPPAIDTTMAPTSDTAKLLSAELESARLTALRDLQVLDTEPELVFDDLAWLAARLCDTPIALTSLIDAERLWYKAHCGLEADQASRNGAFCAYAIAADDLMEVPDTLQDPRFCSAPMVLGPPHIRFYAGAPLIGREGHRYGTLCVIDSRPRTLDAVQREGLQRLARRTVDGLEARRNQHLAEARKQTLQRLLEAMPDGVVTCTAEGQLDSFNRRARDWLGVDPRREPSEQWSRAFGIYQANGRELCPTERLPLVLALQGELVQDTELVLLPPDQPPRHIICYADALRGADGRILGAVCVMRDITAARASQLAARMEAQRFHEAFHAASQGMALISLEGRWMEVNAATCAIFGYGRDALMTLDFQQLTHPEDLGADLKLVQEVLAGTRDSYQMDKRYFHRDGSLIHAHLSVSIVRDAEGQPLHFVSQIQDLTQQRLAEQALRESENRLRTIADNVPALIGRVSADLRYEFVNAHYARWFGRAPEDIIGRHMREILRPEHYAMVQQHLDTVLSGQPVCFEVEVPTEAGLRHLQANYLPVERCDSAGLRTGFHLMVQDVTAQVGLARVLQAQAMTDTLTGLPNRAAWMAHLEHAVAMAQLNDQTVAVLFLDLDGFKQVNDRHGHQTGDALLRAFGTRLKTTLGRGDFLARLSGDEFVVALDCAGQGQTAAVDAVERIMRAMERPLQAGALALHITPSIGLAVQRGTGCGVAALMREADAAMYGIKRRRASQRGQLRSAS